MIDNTNILILISGGILSALFSVGLFMAKDIYTKVGEVTALKERVRALEAHSDDNKKTSEVVIRLEEQMKNLLAKVDMLTAALVSKGHNSNV
jgi:hypothetical protein